MGYILRATAKEGLIRIFAAITTDMVEKAREIHNLNPITSIALGRFLTAGSIMGSMLKSEEDTLTLSMNGGGPIGNMVVVSNATGNVKGYVSNPWVDLITNENGKLDIAAAVGKKGQLNIIKDLGLKEPYVGQVPIYTGEIGDDLAYYFTSSEQVPSAVTLGVTVDTDLTIKAAGGLIIQLMPGADEFLGDIITYRLEEVPPLSTLISEGKTGEDLLNLFFDDMELKIHERIEVEYKCDCSLDRITRALISMGKDELRKINEEQDSIQLECHFCDKKYNFSKEDINNLLATI